MATVRPRAEILIAMNIGNFFCRFVCGGKGLFWRTAEYDACCRRAEYFCQMPTHVSSGRNKPCHIDLGIFQFMLEDTTKLCWICPHMEASLYEEMILRNLIFRCDNIQSLTEMCGQTLGTNSRYKIKKKCPHQHGSGNINL
jgi:hypothetical protein